METRHVTSQNQHSSLRMQLSIFSTTSLLRRFPYKNQIDFFTNQTHQTLSSMKMKSISLLLLLILFSFATLALATKDPELKQCKHQCRAQRQYTEEDKEHCLKECERYYEEKKQRKPETGDADEPEERLSECQKLCDKHVGGEQRALCRFRCQERYIGRQGSDRDVNEWNYDDREEKEEEEKEEGGGGETRQDENPYVFEPRHFLTRVKTQHGRIAILTKFDEKSELLRSLKYYRIAVLEAEPLTLVSPSHSDADAVVYVANGKHSVLSLNFRKKGISVAKIRPETVFIAYETDFVAKCFIAKSLTRYETCCC